MSEQTPVNEHAGKDLIHIHISMYTFIYRCTYRYIQIDIYILFAMNRFMCSYYIFEMRKNGMTAVLIRCVFVISFWNFSSTLLI